MYYRRDPGGREEGGDEIELNGIARVVACIPMRIIIHKGDP